MKPESASKKRKIVTVAMLVVLVAAALTFGFGHGVQVKLVPVPGASLIQSQPANVTMNVTVDGLSYLNEPTQFMWTGANDSFPSEKIVNNTDWVLNTSAYQVFNNNKSTAAQSSPAYASFSMGPYLGTNISYLYGDSRIALNGTETFYYVLSQNDFSAFPTATGSSDTVYMEAAYSSGNYTVTYNYFTSSGLHSGTFTSQLAPLQFYEFFVLVQTNDTVFSIQQNGVAVDSVTVGPSNLSSVISQKASSTNLYSEYMAEAGASTTNTSMILNFGYMVDHDVYSASTNVSKTFVQAGGPAAGVITGTLAQSEPFDPGTTNASFSGPVNQTSIYGNEALKPTVNITDFQNVSYAGSNSSIASAGLNISDKVGNITANTTVNADQAYTTLSVTNETDTSVSAELEVYTWNATNVGSALLSFLRNYVSGTLAVDGYNVPAGQVTIANYFITQMGFVQKYNNFTANQIRDAIFNGYAASLVKNNLTLVNSTTNAIVAGAFAGDFWFAGMAVHPVVQGSAVIDPASGAAFGSLQAAGFVSGSYIAGGAVIVPTYVLQGFSDGPVYTTYGFSLFGWNPLGSGLTAAGSAVQDFFGQAASDASNVVSQASSGYNNLVVKPLQNTGKSAYSSLSSDVSKIQSDISPVIGGTISKVTAGGNAFVSTLRSVPGDLGSAASSTAGALATGANDVKNSAMNIGDTVYNTAGKEVNASTGVLSALYAKATATDASIYAKENDSLHTGINALDKVGGSVSNAYTLIRDKLVGAGGAVVHALSGDWHWVVGFAGALGHILEYVGIGIVVAVGLVLFLMLYSRKGEETDEGAEDFVGNDGPSL